MTGAKNNSVRGDLKPYFASKRFRKRLDHIRNNVNDPSLIRVYAFQVAEQFGLLQIHTDVILYYLETGKYKPQAAKPTIHIVDHGRQMGLPAKDPRKVYDQIIQTNDIGVAIELNEDTSQSELHGFIDTHWIAIKQALDSNFPDRKKLFKPVEKINDYLTIADVLNKIDDPHKKAQKAADLANRYFMETPNVYRVAKKYAAILVD